MKFGLSYKVGKNNKYWRLGVLDMGYNNRDNSGTSIDNRTSSANINLSVGREIRKELSDEFQFKYGLALLFGYSYSKQESDTGGNSSRNWYTGLGFPIGFNYLLNEKFIFSAEIRPNLRCTSTKAVSDNPDNIIFTESESEGFNFFFSKGAANLTIAYRFSRNK